MRSLEYPIQFKARGDGLDVPHSGQCSPHGYIMEPHLEQKIRWEYSRRRQKMKKARKEKELTQQELADLSHVSIKQIAKIEKGKINPSYLILKALAKVLSISLDSLINPNVSPEDEGINQMKMFYSSCPLEMRKTLLRLTQETTRELTELSKNFETK